MAIKFKINKAAYDGLSDEQKALYMVGDTEGEYVLDVTDLPKAEDVGPIKRALATEKEKVKTLTGEKATLQATIDAAPDVAALTAKHEKEVAKYKSFTEKTLLDGTATGIATKISTVPSLLSDKVKSRLVVDLDGDEPVVRVLGKDGKVDKDLTPEKLQQEFVANPEFKTIIIGSKASGGGAPPAPVKPLGGGAPKADENGQPAKFDFAKASPQELAAHITATKEAAAASAT